MTEKESHPSAVTTVSGKNHQWTLRLVKVRRETKSLPCSQLPLTRFLMRSGKQLLNSGEAWQIYHLTRWSRLTSSPRNKPPPPEISNLMPCAEDSTTSVAFLPKPRNLTLTTETADQLTGETFYEMTSSLSSKSRRSWRRHQWRRHCLRPKESKETSQLNALCMLDWIQDQRKDIRGQQAKWE